MKKALFVAIFATTITSTVALLGCTSTDAVDASEPQGDISAPLFSRITSEEAKRMIDEGDVAIVDVRTESEYDEAHIPGAISLPFDEIGTNKLGPLPDLDETIIVYCRTGVQSKLAVGKLMSIGYTDVYDLGGIRDWMYSTERGSSIG